MYGPGRSWRGLTTRRRARPWALAEAQLGAAQKGFAEDQARLREAEQHLERRQRLLKEEVVGRAEVDTAQSEADAIKARIAYSQQQIAVAESQVRLRKTDLDDMVVRAPFGGVAISKDAQPGEMVSPVSAGGGFTRTGICTIVDMASLKIEVDVNESYINRVKPAQKVEAVLDAYPDWRIPAYVITTVPTADRQKATVRVRIGFDALDPRILPDMGVKVSFLRDDEPAPAATAPRPRMLAPKTAVRQVDGTSVVFVVREDRVERRAVQVGAEDGDQVEVLSLNEAMRNSGFADQAGWYVIKIADPEKSGDIAKKVDEMFANSPAETKTDTEKAFVQGSARQIGNISLITQLVATAAILMILLVTANTMAQSIRERTNELAVLKTLGFRDGRGLAMVLAESCLIAVVGGAAGLVASWTFVSVVGDPTGGFLPTFFFPVRDLVIGAALVLLLGVAAGTLPAVQAGRLRIVEALRRN